MTGSITFRCVWACARSLPGRSDKRYLEGQIFLRLDSSPLPAIRPDSPVCDTSDSECDSVSLGPSQPWYQRVCVCVLRASVCSPSLCMKHFFNFLLLCTPGEDVRVKHICGSARRFIARLNTRAEASSIASLPRVGESGVVRRAPPLLCLLFARQLIIETASPYAGTTEHY